MSSHSYCGNPYPGGGTRTCVKQQGHKSLHQSIDRTKWPDMRYGRTASSDGRVQHLISEGRWLAHDPALCGVRLVFAKQEPLTDWKKSPLKRCKKCLQRLANAGWLYVEAEA